MCDVNLTTPTPAESSACGSRYTRLVEGINVVSKVVGINYGAATVCHSSIDPALPAGDDSMLQAIAYRVSEAHCALSSEKLRTSMTSCL